MIVSKCNVGKFEIYYQKLLRIQYLLKPLSLSRNQMLDARWYVVDRWIYGFLIQLSNFPFNVWFQFAHSFWYRVAIYNRFEIPPQEEITWVKVRAVARPRKRSITWYQAGWKTRRSFWVSKFRAPMKNSKTRYKLDSSAEQISQGSNDTKNSK